VVENTDSTTMLKIAGFFCLAMAIPDILPPQGRRYFLIPFLVI